MTVYESKLSYRINDDGISSWNRYSFSYLAQFESINANLEYCAARIWLPKKEKGNLRDRDEILGFLVYAVCEIYYDRKYVLVRNIQLFDTDNKIGYEVPIDNNSIRIMDFFKNEILVDRYCSYFLEKPVSKEGVYPFDYCSPAVLMEANIMYENDSEYIVHKMVDKIIFNIVNIYIADSVDFPRDLHDVLLSEMYKLEKTDVNLKTFEGKDLSFYIKNPDGLDDKSLRECWFKEDKDHDLWEYI